MYKMNQMHRFILSPERTVFVMKITTLLKNRSHILAAILIIIQPVLDVVSYWMDQFAMSNTLTLLLRLGVLGLTLLFAFVITDKKHVYLIAATVMAA